MTNGKRIVVLGLMIAAFAFSTNSKADGKVYSASSCVARVQTILDGQYVSSGHQGNSTSSEQFFYCPAINDSLSTSVESGWFNVKDENSTANVGCQLNTVYESIGTNSLYSYSSGYQYSSGSSSNWQRLSFGSVTCRSQSSIYYFCRVPSDSWLASYYVNE